MMKNEKNVYYAPEMEVMDVKIEKGFAISKASEETFDPEDWTSGDTSNWEY